MGYIIYAKRVGFPDTTGTPQYDKTFRALSSQGFRVNRLSDAMVYAEREDAEALLRRPNVQKWTAEGIVEYEIRKAK